MTAVADPARRADGGPRLQAGPPTPPARAGLPRHLPGLDGLRALAIVAVIVFHLNPAWLPGGYLGVDVFFVVSGFLITTLLVRERRDNGRVDLAGFWTRRARRLLPALLVCVPVSVLLARIVESDLLVGIGRQVLGALTFSTNWVEILAGSDYFRSTTPQLFMSRSSSTSYGRWPPSPCWRSFARRGFGPASLSGPGWRRRWRWRSSTTLRVGRRGFTTAPTPT